MQRQSVQNSMKTLRKLLSRVRTHRRVRKLTGKGPTQEPGYAQRLVKVISAPSTTQTDCNGSSSSNPVCSPAPIAVSEEILLASWLITLLRTREDGEVSYEWAYSTREDGGARKSEAVMRLSTKDVMSGLDSVVEQVAAAISRHIATASPTLSPDLAGHISLLLSAGSLSQEAEDTSKGEVSACPESRVHLLPVSIADIARSLRFILKHALVTPSRFTQSGTARTCSRSP